MTFEMLQKQMQRLKHDIAHIIDILIFIDKANGKDMYIKFGHQNGELSN